ncbi:hypothetical protein RHSIM_RhsimUnG0133700 [Rhododendron simsii]|uniref:Retroviral polymerase SH3-like domain-containing protein n=1 Tax=Rhododendron simsii TaxID=118357 RepID=A0A834G0T7_RHOSS|nr:hypothetical protein RHSIM_RhsimUnG0133700 [Rhododendron simsii]
MISLMSNRFWQSSIRSLPDPLWKDIKIVLTHNEGIKNFDDISRHLELEAERIDANNSAALVAKAGQCNERRSQRKDSKRELDKEGLKRWGQKKAGLMMVQADLPKSFWGDALLTAAYVFNRVPSKSVSSTPYELWNGEKPNLEGLRPWGTTGHVHNTSHKHGKLGPRANKCVFIRYSEHSKGYVLLVSYSDADGSADRDERKSVSGYAFILGGGVITWCSKKQQCVSLSTMELEYVACTTANQEAIWLRRFLQSLSVTGHLGEAVVLHCDSTSAIAYARDPKYHGCMEVDTLNVRLVSVSS